MKTFLNKIVTFQAQNESKTSAETEHLGTCWNCWWFRLSLLFSNTSSHTAGRLFAVHLEKALAVFALFLRLRRQLLHSPDEHNSQLPIRCRLVTNFFPLLSYLKSSGDTSKYFLKIISQRERLHSKKWDLACLQIVTMHGICFALPFWLHLLILCQVICIYCWLSSISKHYLVNRASEGHLSFQHGWAAG